MLFLMRIDDRQDTSDRAQKIQDMVRRHEADMQSVKPQDKAEVARDDARRQGLQDDKNRLQHEQDTRHVQGQAQPEAARSANDLPASEQVQEAAGTAEDRLRAGQDFLKTREERELPPSVEDRKAEERREEHERSLQVQDILKQFAIDQRNIRG